MDACEVFGDVDMVIVARRLFLARTMRKMTQRQVAWAANLQPTHYTDIERGRSTGMRINTLYKLCQVLRVSADVLLGLQPWEEE